MKLFYDSDIDYLEVFFRKTKNYGEDTAKGVTTFKSESNDNVVGFGFYRPNKVVPTSVLLQPKTKIAILCYIKRKSLGLTERELAAKLELSYRTYQRIEEGGITKIDDLFKITRFISEVDFSKIIRAS